MSQKAKRLTKTLPKNYLPMEHGISLEPPLLNILALVLDTQAMLMAEASSLKLVR